jgi:hypothetical protein
MKCKRLCETLADTSSFEECFPSTKPALHTAVNALSHAFHKSFHRICRNSTRGSSRKNADFFLLHFAAHLLVCIISEHICVPDFGAHLFVYFVSKHTFRCTSFRGTCMWAASFRGAPFCVLISENPFWFTSFRSLFVCLFRSTPFICPC